MNAKCKEEELFQKSFEAYVFERLEQIGAEYRTTGNYLEFSQEERELYSRIKELLPRKSAPLFTKYTDILYGAITEQHDYYYRCGLRDSINLIKHLLEGAR